MAPWRATEGFSKQPHIKAVDGNFLGSDKVELHANVRFSFALRPEMAAKVRTHIGNEEKFTTMVEGLCQSALREAAAEMLWTDAAVTKRKEFELKMHEHAVRLVTDSFRTFGFSEQDAAQVVIFQIPVVLAATPPERLTLAIAEQQASKEDLTKQKTMTEIAEEVAKRRKQEGLGIAQMLEALPSGTNPAEVAVLINANAKYNLAGAVKDAVTAGKQNITFVVGTESNPTVSAK